MSREVYKSNLKKFNNFMTEEQMRSDDLKSELGFQFDGPLMCSVCGLLEDNCECEDEDEFFGFDSLDR